VYWHHFVLVACIFGRFGLTNQDGSRAVYSFCGHIRHSCSPNAAWFTLHKGFPRGKKMLHTINLEGIARGEEITVSYVDESVLILPKVQRSVRMFATASMSCTCRRCGDSNEEEDERIRYLFGKLMASLAVKPPSDDSAATALRSLNELDKLLPFSMQAKAKAKVLLASILGELSQRAAWQEENKSANIIQWTGLDAESQEQRLKDTKQLYETAAKDFEYLLGQDAMTILARMESGYVPVQDQHKMLAKYSREKERAADQGYSGAQGPSGNEETPRPERRAPGASQPGMPPGWDELFKGKSRPRLT
ncbi:unnamed protein product, partial [Polarella glacialis]